MNLLIIEDDRICSYITARVAKTSGIFREIESVKNGKDALDIFEGVSRGTAAAPDVILLDLDMPLMDGFTFIEALQQSTFYDQRKLSIVILTSSDDPANIRRARSLGIEHYLLKSLDHRELQDSLFAIYLKHG